MHANMYIVPIMHVDAAIYLVPIMHVNTVIYIVPIMHVNASIYIVPILNVNAAISSCGSSSTINPFPLNYDWVKSFPWCAVGAT